MLISVFCDAVAGVGTRGTVVRVFKRRVIETVGPDGVGQEGWRWVGVGIGAEGGGGDLFVFSFCAYKGGHSLFRTCVKLLLVVVLMLF